MNEVELKERFKSFALRAFKVCDALPHNYAGRAIGGQLSRCAPSAGASINNRKSRIQNPEAL